MHEMKRGQLKSGRSGKKVKSRKQAVAIALSEARRSGGKVPARKRSRKKSRKGTEGTIQRTQRTMATARTGNRDR
jgi:hypothetical protein